jgi:glycine hydroxymethyltransferase
MRKEARTWNAPVREQPQTSESHTRSAGFFDRRLDGVNQWAGSSECSITFKEVLTIKTMRSPSVIQRYLTSSGKSLDEVSEDFLRYLLNLDAVAKVSPVVAEAIVKEISSQRKNLKLIASENFSSLATQSAMANLLTDKYAEGVPFSRFYAGCDNVDTIESRACDLATQLFGADHAYVQPHSGADANLVAYWAILSAKTEHPALERLGAKDSIELAPEHWEELRKELGSQKLLGMELTAGGHLTHGFRRNVSARIFETLGYGVDADTGLLDYDRIERIAEGFRPLILLAGYSAYPRTIDFERMRNIADKVGAVLMVDMAHFAGLVAGKVFQGRYSPFPYADVVTTTTHKTLRGPRGGLVLCRKEFASYVDKGCPLVLGGPLPHVIAAKAVAFEEALRPDFADYARRVVQNAQSLSQALARAGLRVLTGGTDNHLVLVDVSKLGLTGRQAERAARDAGITLNRNTIPDDPNGAWYTSGLRLGTPALTTLGMASEQMNEVASILSLVLHNTQPAAGSKANYVVKEPLFAEARARSADLLAAFPLYPELDLGFLTQRFLLKEDRAAASLPTKG